MAVFNLFLSTLLLPFIAVILLWRRPRKPFPGWIANLVMAMGVVGFSLLAAPWGFFGVPVRILLAVSFLAALILSLRRSIPENAPDESALRLIVKVAIGFFFGGVAVGVLQAYRVPGPTVDLGLPLRDGTFLVMHGGSTPAANLHFGEARQRYGIDFVELNGAGFRARGLYPSDLRAFEIFGEDVLSPCEGSVTSSIDQFGDGVPDVKNPLGNQVVLRCGDVLVTLAQLQRGSVAVRPGAWVAKGTMLALVGSSGISPEPHLHIHAERNGESVPITLGGRWLVRNAVVRR
jgi:hypothetical protein